MPDGTKAEKILEDCPTAQFTMTPQEEERIRTWNDALAHEVRIGVHRTEDERTGQFEKFCEAFAHLAPKVSIVNEDGATEQAPGIQIGSTVRYHAIPLGTELEPFLEAVSGLDTGYSVPESIGEGLQRVKMPASLNIFIAPECPFCPHMVRKLIPLAGASELVWLSVVDSALFPEMAQANQIQSVPTVVLDEQFRWTGEVPLQELGDVMINRDPAGLGPGSLENMLKQGDAFRVAEMMIDRHSIFPAFLTLLTHEKWPVRLGAMVALEEITGRVPELAVQVLDPLWQRFHEVEDPVKGDIIYMMGECGGRDLTPKLESVLEAQHHPEVKEAAREALDKIRNSPK